MVRLDYGYDEYLGYDLGHMRVKEIKRSIFSNAIIWVCECKNCGATKEVMASQAIKGVNLECLCDIKNNVDENENNKVYSSIEEVRLEDRDRLARIHRIMIKRCYDENYISYKNYGELGIRVDSEWLEDKNKFILWAVNNGYRKWLNIDRINKRGNYNSDNCIWVIRATNKISDVNSMEDSNLELINKLEKIEGVKLKLLKEDLENNSISSEKKKVIIENINMLVKNGQIEDKEIKSLERKIIKDVYKVKSSVIKIGENLDLYKYLKDDKRIIKNKETLEKIIIELNQLLYDMDIGQ